MDYHMRWHQVNTCFRLMCAYHAYVTMRRTLGVTCLGSRHFVNKVMGQHVLVENKQEIAEFYSQHLPMHFRGVIWKIKSKSNFPMSFNLLSAEMNLVGNYRTLRGLRTVNPEGLPSTRFAPSQWEMSLQINAVSHWRGTNLESVLIGTKVVMILHCCHRQEGRFCYNWNAAHVNHCYVAQFLGNIDFPVRLDGI